MMKRNVLNEFNDKKWEQVRTHPYYEQIRKMVLSDAERMMNELPKVITFTDIHEYVVSGDRTRFQRIFNDYGSRIKTFFVAYMITEDETYISHLADSIWMVCNMESWTIPAHVAENLSVERRRRSLDLTSTKMGFEIAEVLYFIGDKLPDLVRRRAENEVRERVIDAYAMYRGNEFWWYKATNNWSSVCIAGVLCAYIYLASDEEIERELPRMLKSMDCYLDGFDDEGCCLEGSDYWNYGFAYFCIFASMLRDYTDGKINLFDNPKVRSIAEFPLRIALDGKNCANFSDAALGYNLSPWLMPFIKSVYPDINLPRLVHEPYSGPYLRYILWQDPDLAVTEFVPSGAIYKEAQWFLRVTDKYSFAAKAGYNNEPHNHLDVGSFMLVKDGKVSFCDPGKGEYTRQYFSPERYNYFVTSSRGHSVPIINGKYQVKGEEKSELYRADDCTFEFSMKNAYSDDTLTDLRRCFECGADTVVMTDTYEFTAIPESVTERFIAAYPITVGDGVLTSGNGSISYDKEKFDVTVSSETVMRTNAVPEEVYFADLTVKSPKISMTFTFEIK